MYKSSHKVCYVNFQHVLLVHEAEEDRLHQSTFLLLQQDDRCLEKDYHNRLQLFVGHTHSTLTIAGCHLQSLFLGNISKIK